MRSPPCRSTARSARSSGGPAPRTGRSCDWPGAPTARGRRRCAGVDLLVPRSVAPPLGEDEWYAEDLEGCRVTDGVVEIGVVRRMLALPSCEVLEVERPVAGDLLVPLVRDAVRTVDLDAPPDRRRPRVPGGDGVRIDVFTLFPEWFEWFGGQRHVANAVAAGSEVRYANYRDWTPLSGGQVDDTPFGGGAGMVLRVDVVDLALRGFYGRDPLELHGRRRIVALTPVRTDARRRARGRARRRARPDAAVRPLRGLRRADRRAHRDRRDLDRALRARRRRACGDGADGRGAAQAAGGARP